MIDTIVFKGIEYPMFQAEGNASQFAIPFAKLVCKGKGYDIGYSHSDWMLPGSIGIDIKDNTPYSANSLPDEIVDYIYSSHCLEHLDDWVETLDLWLEHIKAGGVLFLYLPHFEQVYWRPWHNRQHKHVLSPEIIKCYLEDSGQTKFFISERDLNYSFMVMVEKR